VSIVNRLLERIADNVVESGEKVRASIASGFAETSDAIRVGGARTVRIPVNTSTGTPVPVSGLLANAPARLMGWTLRNPTGASSSAVVDLYDGADANADLIASAQIGPTSVHAWFGPGGVAVTDRLFVAVTVLSGSPQLLGGIYLGPA
jgi:hypothetical protein